MATSRGHRFVADSPPHRRASSSCRSNGEGFELAVQFFPELVGAVELPFGFGVLDAEDLEPLSLTIDSGYGDGIAQVVEPRFQPADIAFRRHQLLLEPGLTPLSGPAHGRSLRGNLRDRSRR